MDDDPAAYDSFFYKLRRILHSSSHIFEVLQFNRTTANTARPNQKNLIKYGGRSNGSNKYLLIDNKKAMRLQQTHVYAHVRGTCSN